MKIKSICFFLIICTYNSFAQSKRVAITFDDAPFIQWSPKTPVAELKKSNQKILDALTKYNVPAAVFINESPLIKEGETDERLQILKLWIDNPLVTLGNHGYTHANYAEMSASAFKDEIMKGEVITKKLLAGTNKKLEYFRFPFNAVGKDSITKNEMELFLKEKGYISTPFTIESSDYMFNTLYQKAIDENNRDKADKIARDYISYTLTAFAYFDKLSNSLYHRSIAQIFLCHDNQLNADHFGELAIALRTKGYDFIDLKTALNDSVYKNTDYYNERHGVSWVYRWIKESQSRMSLMKQEPSPPKEIYDAYIKLSNTK
jgi:peptidoglycan-N-acetylglucosamine deacetylase